MIERTLFVVHGPRVRKLATTVRLADSLLRAEDGYEGKRFQRTCKELWKRNPIDNIVELFPETGDAA